ncbi:SET domain protein [Metarhizium album ARSEF 1941]|uniref:SET domain protein n=1 Tax=Metarhizium album (strain ARSEF 1941) TaxID=1081103 RepID=A0A0B2WS00_METAS|nr:SET domain protein [Metarhizium album ARSEF 1941]KHN96788.1 SET domain protein [Metarhizium album ARSEF 1941]
MSTTGSPDTHTHPDVNGQLTSRLQAFGVRKPTSRHHSPFGRATTPISPLPLRRQLDAAPGLSGRKSSLPASLATESSLFALHGVHDTHLGHDSLGSGFTMARQTTPPPPLPPSRLGSEAPAINGTTPKAQTDSNAEWTIPKIIDQLNAYRQDVKDGHAKLTGYILESTKVAEQRIHHGRDLFANIRTPVFTEKKSTTMRIKSKQHLKGKRDHREGHYTPICTKTNKERVPSYRFHHVEIKKNVLTPNTMLTFVPHLRDLESSEETKYNLWLKELEDIDLKSGFKPMNREDKQQLTIQGERAATVSLYLDTWLEDMAIPGCDKSALISYMAAREPDYAITPQQKSDILNSHRNVENAAPGANKAARMFTDAFQQVFKASQPASKQIELRRVLMMDESVDNIMDSKPIAKDATSPQLHDEDEDELAESNLATYCILGCLICFSHSCDHGEYDNKNMKRTFSISSCSHLSDALKQRRNRRGHEGAKPTKPCRRQCYQRTTDHARMHLHPRAWLEDERIVLRSIFTTASHSTYTGDPICLAAEFLNRHCDEVHAEFMSMGVSLPQPEPPDAPRIKNLPWYDRRRKALLGDWQDHTTSHAHQRRENLEPCSHEGPCVPGVCTCVDADVLCEKFCGCTVDSCAYKFTGCACHSQGKNCQDSKKDRPCICVQLNRECDPQLCVSCGALERADPLNADDAELHATGCQNCDLQRGVGKPLLLGQSQLDGVGYGLFTAEDIAQDEFIIEYVGELITHDEGVRREARRGDVFDEESNVSYVFTLLENEGIWVDAAIYGNLSRYINHASEHDNRGCNITPRILYVNGEYRIKFTAIRDIEAGEELFFNYGENFPNLTKKLLDHKAAAKPETKNKPAKSRRPENPETIARKATRAENSKRRPGRPRVKRDLPPGFALETVVIDPVRPVRPALPGSPSRKRKRRLPCDSDDDYDGAGSVQAVTGEQDARGSEEPGSASRLRRRARTSAETPTKLTEQPKKTRGKRGGARPGSGRPRKHPRPVPRPPAASEGKGADGATAAGDAAPREAGPDKPSAPTTTAVVVSVPGLALASARRANTPEPKRVTRKSERTEMEIADSDDNTSNAPLRGSGTKAAAEDDDDEDVLVRQRRDRASRTRRPPAKFRDDDVWN